MSYVEGNVKLATMYLEMNLRSTVAGILGGIRLFPTSEEPFERKGNYTSFPGITDFEVIEESGNKKVGYYVFSIPRTKDNHWIPSRTFDVDVEALDELVGCIDDDREVTAKLDNDRNWFGRNDYGGVILVDGEPTYVIGTSDETRKFKRL